MDVIYGGGMYNTYLEDAEASASKSVSQTVFRRALEVRGISFKKKKGCYLLDSGGWFRAGWISLNEFHANAICESKPVTKAVMAQQGVQVLPSRVFDGGQLAPCAYAESIGFPVVLKPLDAMGGKGVVPNIVGADELVTAWANKGARDPNNWMIEKHFDGVDHRFLVVDGEVVAVLRREPPVVIGDGVSSVRSLVEMHNAMRTASNNPVHKKVRFDSKLTSSLGDQGFHLDCVPATERQIVLVATSNISSGGNGTDVTDEIEQKWKNLACKAVCAVPGLRFGGVDILIDKARSDHAIIEINHNPMISMHHYPWVGKPRNIADILIDKLLAEPTP